MPNSAAYSDPVSAATAAPHENASSFSQLTGMPIASAASGSSRSERHARPVRELFSSRSATNTTTKIASATYRYETAKTPLCCGRQLVPAGQAEGVDVEDPERAAGDVLPVRRHRLEELQEEQRHDREVVAREAPRRQAEHETRERADHDDERHRDERRQVDAVVRRVEQRVRVRADAVERDVAEVEEAAPADDDVEAEREQHVEDGLERDLPDVPARSRRSGTGRRRRRTASATPTRGRRAAAARRPRSAPAGTARRRDARPTRPARSPGLRRPSNGTRAASSRTLRPSGCRAGRTGPGGGTASTRSGR